MEQAYDRNHKKGGVHNIVPALPSIVAGVSESYVRLRRQGEKVAPQGPNKLCSPSRMQDTRG